MSTMQTRFQLYRNHLESKRLRMVTLLETIGCEQLCQKITPSPLKKGFRNRAKFQVYESQGTVRIEGTDPFNGAVPFEQALWILPDWARRIVIGFIFFFICQNQIAFFNCAVI